jgi:hypothetical protein
MSSTLIAPQVPKVPTTTYVIRSRPQHQLMRYSKLVDNTHESYVLTFMHRHHAEMVQKHVCEFANIIALPEVNSITYIEIEKKVNINKLSCYIQEKEFQEMLTFPFVYNVGVSFVCDIVDETKSKIILEAISMEPLQNTALAQKMLADQLS